MNIRSVRKKIKSVANVKKITRAMQLVSAVKMRKSQLAALEAAPYQDTLTGIVSRVSTRMDASASNLMIPGHASRRLAILVMTNKGLCGAFNMNLMRYIMSEPEIKNTDFITIGKKATMFAAKMRGEVLADYSTAGQDILASVPAIINQVISLFTASQTAQVTVYYNKFVSALKYEPTYELLLPASKISSGLAKEAAGDYMMEPRGAEIIDFLIRTYIEERLRYVILQSEAGEHSARMVAMKNATDNATELIYNLTAVRNKLRQQKITYELLDMITAKESVESN